MSSGRSPVEMAPSAEEGPSHSCPGPPKAVVAPEAIAEALQKYLTGLLKKKKGSTEPKLKPDVGKAEA